MELSVRELRRSGYKVRVGHKRFFEGEDIPLFRGEWHPSWKGGLLPRGGLTLIKLTSPEGLTVESEAKCSPKDVYNKKFGVKVALGRALKTLRTSDTKVDETL